MQQAQLQQLLLNTPQNPPNPGAATANTFRNRGAPPTAGGSNAPTVPQRPSQSPNTPQNVATNERYAVLRQRIFHARLGAQALARIHDRNNNPPHYFLPTALHRLFAQIGSFVPIPAYLRRTLNVFGALRINMAHNLIHLTQNQTRLNNLRRITLNSIEIRPINIPITMATVTQPVTPPAGTEPDFTENNYSVQETRAEEPHSTGAVVQDSMVHDVRLIEEDRQPVPVEKSCIPNVDEVANAMATTDDETTRQSKSSHQGSFSGNTISSCGASSLSERPLSPGSTSTSSSVAAASK